MSNPSLSWRIREFFEDRVVSLTVFAVLASISVFCFVQGNRDAARQTQPLALTQASAATPTRSKYVTKPIRDARLGDWVLADNPELPGDVEGDYRESDAAQWKRLVLRMEKPGGDVLDIELLRSLSWIEWTGASAGETIQLAIEEMHVHGPAYVQFVGPCPALAPRPSPRHHLVTGTFAHSSASTVGLYVEGLVDPIRCTENHPFWSEDRQEFVQAGSLLPNERLVTTDGSSHRVDRVIRSNGTVPVYNIEVHSQHTYFVSSLGLLAHNAGTDYAPNRGFTIVDSGVAARKVRLVPNNPLDTAGNWGLRSGHLKKHFFGNSKFSLRTIDPGGTPDAWMGHISRLFGRSETSRTANGMIDIIGEFARADGSGVFKLGVRLAPNADGTFDLITILTKQ